MNLIKIKVNDKDRETLASMLDYAVSLANEKLHESYSCEDADYFIKLEKKFKDLRQRVVFEELEEPKEEYKTPLPDVKWSDLNKMETFLNNSICSSHAVIEEVENE